MYQFGMISTVIGTGILGQPQNLQATLAAAATTALGHFLSPKIGCAKSGSAGVWQAPGPGTEYLPDNQPGDEVDPHVHLLYLWEMLGQTGRLPFAKISKVSLSGERELGYFRTTTQWDLLRVSHEMIPGLDQQNGEGNMKTGKGEGVCTLPVHVLLIPLDLLDGKLKNLNQPILHLQARHFQCPLLNQCRRPLVRGPWGIVS